ncbi:LysR family transcriptional regulator [Collinsella sp. An2]|uniref:LysR family transcriptional regulator n=1 Tax=Collinsella sp. An2 TaxID=1965585 RepID=UPI000B3A425F|nr:LysR family transcriptional regulator [Collinsella sp. An2]OUP10833.1 LysR family transcriptional regulator [Collinsella sp. An2]
MELRHLQYFLMIAREGTISGAAQVLHLSQPSLSRQMQDLEHELGCKLFDRGRRRIELTEAGMRLRRRAEEIVDLVGRTEAEFHVSADTLAGEVRIGGGETPAMALVADVVAELQETYPLMRFALHSGNAEDVSERLDNGRIDFGVFVGHANLDRYECLQLPARDRWGVFMPSSDPLASLDVIHAEDLADKPLIFSAQASREMQTWFRRDFAELDVVATYNLLYNASLLARRGVGYVISLEGIVDTSPTSGLAFRPLEPAVTADIFIAWKRYQSFSPAAEVFLSRIRELWG